MSQFSERIVDAVYSGDIALLQVLYDSDFLKPTDTFYNISILHLIARHKCPDYKDLIDTVLNYGVPLDDSMPNTPLEEAIMNKNFHTAFYLESLGGTYFPDEVEEQLENYNEFKLSNLSVP